jgi:hypothetical protein
MGRECLTSDDTTRLEHARRTKIGSRSFRENLGMSLFMLQMRAKRLTVFWFCFPPLSDVDYLFASGTLWDLYICEQKNLLFNFTY